MWGAGQWLLIAILALSSLAGPGLRASVQPARPALQSTTLQMTGPTACPAAGCAAGQRLNLRFDFELSAYDAQPTDPPAPNVKVCFYAPNNWVDAASINDQPQTGDVTGLPYTRAAGCAEDTAPPTGFSLLSAWETQIVNIFAFSDSLNLSFRIAPNASATGRVLARLFERSGNAWPRTQQVFTGNLGVAAPAVVSYVAATASLCDAGSYSPCYLNSADDLPGGVGTGLKDAVDAVQPGSALFLVGSYPIKSNAVQVNKALQISGVAGGNLTATGSACGNPMLLLQDAVVISDLAIDDGPGCAANNRTLIEVNSPNDVRIEYSLLTAGHHAVLVRDNTGAVTVRFNQIQNNAAQAIYGDNGSIFAPLMVEANNIVSNGALTGGQQIECAAGQSGVVPSRKANHNYWGSPSAPNPDVTHCQITPGRQLGAPVVAREGAYGVQAQRFTVNELKTYAFNNEIAFQRSGGSGDFGLFIVNHGYAKVEYTPFNLNGGLNPCSNFWDVFLPDGPVPDGTLNLFFKYNKSQACIAAINSAQYCDQTSDMSRYPLWWYDPASNVTSLWDTTGQNPAGSNAGGGSGQQTACNISENELQVSIDSTGRPNLANDLAYVPIFAGIQVLQNFQVLSSNNVITVAWSTINEPDVTGFYVQRSVDGVNFSPITDLIPRRGSALGGATYSFVDSGRVTGVNYYYRLQIMRPDNNVLYSNTLSTTGTSATATQTFTPGPSATLTRTPGPSPTFTIPPPTRTNTPTLVPVQNPTRMPSPTPTRRTATPTRLALTLPTGAATSTAPAYPAPGQRTASPGATQDGAYPPPDQTPGSTSAATGYPAPGSDGTSAATGYPAPGETTAAGTPAPTQPGTEVAVVQTPGAPTAQIPLVPAQPGSGPPGLLLALLAGYFGGSALLGLGALWYFFLYKKPG